MKIIVKADIFNSSSLSASTISKLRSESGANYKELCASIAELITFLNSLPLKTKFIDFVTRDLKEIHKFTDPTNAIANLIESNINFSYYSQFHKFRKLLSYINSTINENDYYITVHMIRALFEETIYFSHFVYKIRKHFVNIVQYAKGSKNSKDPNFMSQELYHINNELETFIRSGSLDWGKQFGFHAYMEPKKQILNYIDNAEEKSKFPFRNYYDMLCEFVHPNYGSRTMLINSRTAHQKFPDIASILEIGDTDSEDSLLWFLDMFSEPLNRTAVLALNTMKDANEQIEWITGLASKSNTESASTH